MAAKKWRGIRQLSQRQAAWATAMAAAAATGWHIGAAA